MFTLSLLPGTSKRITATPMDSDTPPHVGLVGPNPPAWQTQDATVATVTDQAVDGFTATINVPGDALPGASTTVQLSGADDTGKLIQSSLQVNVLRKSATQYVFSPAS